MCLGIPGKVISISEEDGLLMGKIDFSGSVTNACLDSVKDVKVGQYVIIHAGFALSVLNEEEAKETLGYFDEMKKAAAKYGRGKYDNPLADEENEDETS